MSAILTGADPALLSTATTLGVLAATVQFLGLVRWPFLVPYLARADAAASQPATREAVDVVFQAFNRYLGVAVGEHLGYLLTGAWTTTVGAALLQTDMTPAWVGWLGIATGPLLMLCSLEFIGRHEQHGWATAAHLTPITYVIWSIWLALVGVMLLL